MTNELENAQSGDAQQAVKPANMRWYTLHVYSSMEKSVAKSLRERIDRSELRDQFGEVLLPIEKVEENRNGKRMETERRMYPGYVFVEMVMSEETWHLINSTPRVIEFLGNNHPVPLSPREIAEIQERMSSGQAKARPKVMFEAAYASSPVPLPTSKAASTKCCTTRAVCAASCPSSAVKRALSLPSTRSKSSNF